MNKRNRILAVLLSAILLLTPVLAAAETATNDLTAAQEAASGTIQLTISDPYVNMNGVEYDMSGLSIDLQACSSEEGLAMLLDVLTQGESAFSASLTADDELVLIAVTGMTSVLSLATESLNQMFSAQMGSVSPDMAAFSNDMTELFTEEELAQITAAFEQIVASTTVSEPEISTVTVDGEEVPCMAIEYAVSNESICQFLVSLVSVMEDNETFGAILASAMAEQGIEGDLSDTVGAAFAELGLATEATVYQTETGYMLVQGVCHTTSGEEESSLYFDMETYADETGAAYLNATFYDDPENENSDSIDFSFSAVPSATLEGEMEIGMELNVWNQSEEEPVNMSSITFSYVPELSEEGLLRGFSIGFATSYSSVTLTGTLLAGIEGDSQVMLDLDYSDNSESYCIQLGFDSTPVLTETSQGIEGLLTLNLTMNELALLDAGMNVTASLSSDTFSVDLSDMPVIDVETMDEETSTTVSTELMGALYNLLGMLQTKVPGFASLMNDYLTVAPEDGEPT